MKIGIFGGSFNPPHKTHLNIAKELLEKNYLDKVIFVPTGSKYIYKNNLVDDAKRVKMLELMVKNDSRLLISDFELKDHNVYTYETLEYFKMKYPSDEIFFVCGVDNLSYVDKWMRGLELLSNNKFLVIKRGNEDINSLLNKYDEYRDNIIFCDIEVENYSSTMIRDLLKDGLDISEYVDDEVLKYIKDNKLYME